MKKKDLMSFLESVDDDQEIKICINHSIDADGFGNKVYCHPVVSISGGNPYCYEPILECRLEIVIQESVEVSGSYNVFNINTDEEWTSEELFTCRSITNQMPDISDVFDEMTPSQQQDFIEEHMDCITDDSLLEEVRNRDLM